MIGRPPHSTSILLTLLCLLSAPLHAAPLPGGFAHSGWYQFEVIVMIDTRAETLESETWPLLPTVGYPARWRWLQNEAAQEALIAAHPDATVSSSSSGHIAVRLPALPAPQWQPKPSTLTEGDMSVIDELIEVSQGSDTFSLYSPNNLNLEAADNSEEEPPRPMLPFEEIALAPEKTTPFLGLESLSVAMPESTVADNAISIPFAPAVEAVSLTPVTVVAEPIPTPDSFVQLPLDQLAAGLARYQRRSEDEMVASVSWLQGPSSDTLPILLEADSDTGYPALQGFIQLIPREGSWRMGINFWVNTAGHYLPDIFEMPDPPASPQRITIVQPSRTVIAQHSHGLPSALSQAEAEHPPKAASWLWSEAGDGRATSDHTQARTSLQDAHSAPAKPDWPWRHLIHVADTIPLTENRLRYYDHPVIKVLAIWRELSWYELYTEGKALMDEPTAEVTLIAHNPDLPE